MKITIVNGPNLNCLGERQSEIYGSMTFAQLENNLVAQAREGGCEVDWFQSNHEGALIDKLQQIGDATGVIINPGGLTHSSVSLRDCIAMIKVPVIEVHISNIFSREDFRRRSLVSEVCTAVISGLGTNGYSLALRHLMKR